MAESRASPRPLGKTLLEIPHRHRPDFRLPFGVAPTLGDTRRGGLLVFLFLCRRAEVFGTRACLAFLAVAVTAPSADPIDSATLTNVVSPLPFFVGIFRSGIDYRCSSSP